LLNISCLNNGQVYGKQRFKVLSDLLVQFVIPPLITDCPSVSPFSPFSKSVSSPIEIVDNGVDLAINPFLSFEENWL